MRRLLPLPLLLTIGCVGSKPAAHVPAPRPGDGDGAASVPVTQHEPPMYLSMLLEPTASLEPPQRLSTAGLQEDIDWLLHALRHAWGGYEAIDRDIVEALEHNLSALHRAPKPPASSLELCAELGRLLASVPDAHFDVMLDGAGRCTEAPQHKSRVGRNVAAGRAEPWSWSVHREGGHEVGVLGLTRFLPPNAPAWSGMLDAIDPNLDATIIDLRGNTGGNDTMAYWVAQAVGGRVVRREGVSITRSQHPVALTLMANSMELAIRRAERQGQERPTHLVEIREDFLSQRDAAAAGEIPQVLEFDPSPPEPLDAPHETRAPVVVLTDRRCGSSCENAVYLLRQLPDVTVIGQNTSGAIHTGQAGRLVLPNSKIIVVIATQFVRFADGRFLEKVGFEPDMRLESGQDALAVALEHLGRPL